MIGSYVDVVAVMLMASMTTVTISIVLMCEVLISIVVMVAISMVASVTMMAMRIVTPMLAFVIVAYTRETIMCLSGPVLFAVRVFLDGDQIAELKPHVYRYVTRRVICYCFVQCHVAQVCRLLLP